MSAVAGLYNVPGTPSEWSQWAFINMAHHRDIFRLIYAQQSILLPEFILDPLNPDDPGVWLYQHQRMHEDQNEALGIDGYNLVDVDLSDPEELAGWIYLHSSEHLQAANILGIG